MLKIFINIFKKKFEIFILTLISLIAISWTINFNYSKKINHQNYINFLNNIYLKKTLNNVFNGLEPKYKKINHKIKSGETFDKILDLYSIDKNDPLLI